LLNTPPDPPGRPEAARRRRKSDWPLPGASTSTTPRLCASWLRLSVPVTEARADEINLISASLRLHVEIDVRLREPQKPPSGELETVVDSYVSTRCRAPPTPKTAARASPMPSPRAAANRASCRCPLRASVTPRRSPKPSRPRLQRTRRSTASSPQRRRRQ
jgi:hypothetical protein